MSRYTFDEVRAALRDHWGFGLRRGGSVQMDDRDGRFAAEYSRTGYLVDGHMPGRGLRCQRYASLVDVVRACDLGTAIARRRGR